MDFSLINLHIVSSRSVFFFFCDSMILVLYMKKYIYICLLTVDLFYLHCYAILKLTFPLCMSTDYMWIVPAIQCFLNPSDQQFITERRKKYAWSSLCIIEPLKFGGTSRDCVVHQRLSLLKHKKYRGNKQ